jgi:hypothetical protein
MADSTNAEVPGAGGQLSGDASRQAAIRRLQKQAPLSKPERAYPQLPQPKRA